DVWEYGYDKGRMVAWLRARERPESPKRVRLVTGEPRYDHAYWISLLLAEDPDLFMAVDGSWDERSGELALKTKNAGAIAVDMGSLKNGPARTIEIDGTSFDACAGSERTYLIRQDGAWACDRNAPSLAGKKRAGVSGPLDDVQRHRA